MKSLQLAIFYSAISAVCSCSKSNEPQPQVNLPYADGLTTNNITVAGVAREYLVYKPTGLTQPKAVVLALHGGGGLGADGISQEGQHPMSVFRDVADTAKFLLIYPQGQPDGQGDPAWNDCRSDNKLGRNADDVAYFAALIARLVNETGLTNQKVFMSGGSNGALMTYRYAFSKSGNVRAIAVSSGNLAAVPFSGACTAGATQAVPVLMTHGTADPQMPPDGGCVSNFGGACNRGTVVSQDATIQYWLTRNGLSGNTPQVTSFDVNTNDAGGVVKSVYAGTNPVVSFKLLNAGHSVPSKTVSTANNSTTGIQNKDIEFAAEAWKFFYPFVGR